MEIEIIYASISGLLSGGLIGTLVIHFLTKDKMDAEIQKLIAEAEKAKAETNILLKELGLPLKYDNEDTKRPIQLQVPVLKKFVVTLTIIIPIGIVIWIFMYYLAIEWGVSNEWFIFAVFWLTIILSLFSSLWGILLYPKLINSSILQKFSGREKSIDSSSENTDVD